MKRPDYAIATIKDIYTASGEEIEKYINMLESRLELIQDLAVNYDGFETVEELKSLIDDMVKASKGELKIIGEQPLSQKVDWNKFKSYLRAENDIFHQYQEGKISIGKLIDEIIRIAQEVFKEAG